MKQSEIDIGEDTWFETVLELASDLSQTEDSADVYLEIAIEAVLNITDIESAFEDSAIVLDLEE